MAANNTERGGIATFTLVIAAGERRVVGVRGTFLRVKDAGLPLTISTRSSKIGSGDGREFTNVMKKFEKVFTDTEFDEVVVSHDNDDDQRIELQIGFGDYEAEIISRTLAANSIVVDGADGYVDDTTEPLDPMVVEIPENLQRKRIKIRLIVQSSSGTNVIGSPDIFFYMKNVNVVANAMTDDDAFPMAYAIEVGEDTLPFLLGASEEASIDFELETTAAIYIGALIVGGTYDEYELQYSVRWIEEVYSAA